MPGKNPDPRDYYALLHVSPEASRQEIGRAFRALMRRHHPDIGHPADGNDASAILHAFAVLRDARTRAEYDAGNRRPDVQVSPLNPEADQKGQSGQVGLDDQNGQTGQTGRDIPVRIIRRRDPIVRVLPVRWEPRP